MELRYGATFRKEPGRCPICSAALLQDFVCYMKHLAVEHKVVMTFVERDLEAPKLREEERKREEEGCRKKEEERKRAEEVEKEEKMENEFSAKSRNSEDVGKSNRTTTINAIRSILDSDSDSD